MPEPSLRKSLFVFEISGRSDSFSYTIMSDMLTISSMPVFQHSFCKYYNIRLQKLNRTVALDNKTTTEKLSPLKQSLPFSLLPCDCTLC